MNKEMRLSRAVEMLCDDGWCILGRLYIQTSYIRVAHTSSVMGAAPARSSCAGQPHLREASGFSAASHPGRT